NRPGGKNAEHDCKSDEMRRVKQKSPILVLPDDSQNERVEKYKKRGPLREHAKPKKNRCRHPNEPRRLLLSPKAQPKNDGQPAERTEDPPVPNQEPFSNHADIRNQDQRGGHRARGTKAQARDGEKANRPRKHSKRRRQAGSPFIPRAKKLKCPRHEPVYQRRL